LPALLQGTAYTPIPISSFHARLFSNGDAENAGVENAAPDCRGEKRGSGNRGSLKSMESKDFKNVFLTVLTERIEWN